MDPYSYYTHAPPLQLRNKCVFNDIWDNRKTIKKLNKIFCLMGATQYIDLVDGVLSENKMQEVHQAMKA